MSSGRRLDASEMVTLKGGFHQSGAGGVRTSAGVQRWLSAWYQKPRETGQSAPGRGRTLPPGLDQKRGPEKAVPDSDWPWGKQPQGAPTQTPTSRAAHSALTCTAILLTPEETGTEQAGLSGIVALSLPSQSLRLLLPGTTVPGVCPSVNSRPPPVSFPCYRVRSLSTQGLRI